MVVTSPTRSGGSAGGMAGRRANGCLQIGGDGRGPLRIPARFEPIPGADGYLPYREPGIRSDEPVLESDRVEMLRCRADDRSDVMDEPIAGELEHGDAPLGAALDPVQGALAQQLTDSAGMN